MHFWRREEQRVLQSDASLLIINLCSTADTSCRLWVLSIGVKRANDTVVEENHHQPTNLGLHLYLYRECLSGIFQQLANVSSPAGVGSFIGHPHLILYCCIEAHCCNLMMPHLESLGVSDWLGEWVGGAWGLPQSTDGVLLPSILLRTQISLINEIH